MAGTRRRQGTRRALKARQRRRAATRPRPAPVEGGTVTEALLHRLEHAEAGPRLTGGDVDADWQRAADSGEEGVGGSAATPDQDVVDELGEALGVGQPEDAPVYTSKEILEARRRHYWHLERMAAERDEDEEEAS